MAIDPNNTDTVTIPQLDTLVLALETFLAGSNDNGKMGKFTAQQLADFLTPYISLFGASPFVSNTGSPLPNPIEKITAITFVGIGDFDQTTGANVVTTEELNVLFWLSNGVTGTWSIGVEIPIDLTAYVAKTSIVTDLSSNDPEKVLSASLGELINSGLGETESFTPASALSTYTTESATTVLRLMNKSYNGGSLSKFSAWGTRAGTAWIVAYSKNVDNTFNYENSVQITLALGLNEFTPSYFGDFPVNSGWYVGYFMNPSGGSFGSKSETSTTYFVSSAVDFPMPTGDNIVLGTQTTFGFGVAIEVTAITEIRQEIDTLKANSVQLQKSNTYERIEPAEKSIFFDTDYSAPLFNINDLYTDGLGRRKYTERVGLNTKINFLGSLTLDQVTKSPNLINSLISEAYTTGVSYKLDVGTPVSATTPCYLQIDQTYSLNSLNYTQEIIEFKLDRIASNGFIGLLYAGQTIYSRKLAHLITFHPSWAASGGVNRMGVYHKENIASGAFVQDSGTITSQTSAVNDEYRMIRSYSGRSFYADIYKKVAGEYSLLVGHIQFDYGDCRNRPSNRKYAIAFSNIGVTITKYETYSFEPYRVRDIYIGDSIQSGFSCTDFSLAYSRQGAVWNGIANSVRSGHGCTTADFLPMLPEMLLRKPERLILSLGLNDVRYSVPAYPDNYTSIIDQFEAIGTKVILCQLIPNNDDDVVPFNNWQATTFGATNEIINWYTLMEDPSAPGELNPAYHTDGTHPNDLGNAVMFGELKKYL